MTKRVPVEERIKAKGHEIAQELREFFQKRGIFVVNLIGAPGSGKTSLLEALAPQIRSRAAVIEGDLQTDVDKRRIEQAGLRAYQINTVSACHLDAGMVRDALKEFPLDNTQFLFIENVGNLICPASFELGEDMKVVVISVTEGDDKPAKYPKALRVASAVVITKTDLLPYIPCDVGRLRREIQAVVPEMPIFTTSAQTGHGIEEFLTWIEAMAGSLSGLDRPAGPESGRAKARPYHADTRG